MSALNTLPARRFWRSAIFAISRSVGETDGLRFPGSGSDRSCCGRTGAKCQFMAAAATLPAKKVSPLQAKSSYVVSTLCLETDGEKYTIYMHLKICINEILMVMLTFGCDPELG